MKVLIYSEGQRMIAKSGIGRALKHQERALELNKVDYTLNKKDSFNIVHINTYGLGSYMLAKKAKKQGKKVIIHAHTTEEDFRDSFILTNQISPYFKKWLVKVYKSGDHIITPTPYSKQILEGYGLDVPITAVSNGVDISKFHYSKESGEAFRKEYGFSAEDKIILSVGLFIKRKGVLDFIKLAKSMPEYQFVWCGYTNPMLIPKIIRDNINNPPSNVHFLGYVNNMPGAYSAADLFLMLSYEETEGIVMLEALSAKCPIVVRDIGVYDIWLENNKHCYKGNNNQEFEALIMKCFTMDTTEIVNNGYKVVKELNLDKVGNQLKSIYINCLKE